MRPRQVTDFAFTEFKKKDFENLTDHMALFTILLYGPIPYDWSDQIADRTVHHVILSQW